MHDNIIKFTQKDQETTLSAAPENLQENDNIVLSQIQTEAELEAIENLASLVEKAKKKLPGLFEGVPIEKPIIWEDPIWDMGDTFVESGKCTLSKMRWTPRVNDSEDARGKNVRYGEAYPLKNTDGTCGFGDFARAYLVIRYSRKKTKGFMLVLKLQALSILWNVLQSNGKNKAIYELDGTDFDDAVEFILERKKAFNLSNTYSHNLGWEIKNITRFLDEEKLVSGLLDWENPIKNVDLYAKTGPEYDKRRKKLTLDRETERIIQECFNEATDPFDKHITSCLALLFSNASRGAELLTVPYNCEVRPYGETGKEYGLRWNPVKNGESTVKWIVSDSMKKVTQKAINQIREFTAPAREVARFYEAQCTEGNLPTKLFLPKEYEHLREDPTQWKHSNLFAPLFGMTPAHFRINWRKLKLPARFEKCGPGESCFIRFCDFEEAVLKMLPRGFPIANEHGQLYSELLICQRVNEMAVDRKKPWLVMIEKPMLSQIEHRVSAGMQRSIFDRMGKTMPDGSRVHLKPHSIRRMHGTLTDHSKISPEEEAKDAGRRDIRQNEAYDYTSAEAKAVKVSKIVGKGEYYTLIPFNRQIGSNAAFEAILDKSTTLSTPIGYCTHDFSTAPCERFRQCIKCYEHIMVKGDTRVITGLRRMVDQTEAALKDAEKQIEEGTRNAGEWERVQRETLQLGQQALQIHFDQSLPDHETLIARKPPDKLEDTASGRAIEILLKKNNQLKDKDQ